MSIAGHPRVRAVSGCRVMRASVQKSSEFYKSSPSPDVPAPAPYILSVENRRKYVYLKLVAGFSYKSERKIIESISSSTPEHILRRGSDTLLIFKNQDQAIHFCDCSIESDAAVDMQHARIGIISDIVLDIASSQGQNTDAPFHLHDLALACATRQEEFAAELEEEPSELEVVELVPIIVGNFTPTFQIRVDNSKRGDSFAIDQIISPLALLKSNEVEDIGRGLVGAEARKFGGELDAQGSDAHMDADSPVPVYPESNKPTGEPKTSDVEWKNFSPSARHRIVRARISPMQGARSKAVLKKMMMVNGTVPAITPINDGIIFANYPTASAAQTFVSNHPEAFHDVRIASVREITNRPRKSGAKVENHETSQGERVVMLGQKRNIEFESPTSSRNGYKRQRTTMEEVIAGVRIMSIASRS